MAQMVSKRVLEEIRFRNDIADVIGSYLNIKKAGSSFKALCPFHKEKTPSFHINPQRQIFHCFGCGAGGDIFGFVMQHESVDFMTAVRMLADRGNVTLEIEDREDGAGSKKNLLYQIHEEVAAFYERCLEQMKAAAPARAYLEERGLPKEAIEEFRVGYAPGRWDSVLQLGKKHGFAAEDLETAGLAVRRSEEDARSGHYDRFRNRLMFPIRNEQGKVIAFSGRALEKDAKTAKYVNSPETPLFHKGRVLYAMDKARRAIVDAGECLLCEGQIDVIRCHVAGFKQAAACQGTAFTEDHARILRRYADSVVIVFDTDTAGQDAAIKAAAVFMDAGLAVRVAALPPGEDPDSFIVRKGPEAFGRVIERAESAVAFQVRALSARENAKSEVGLMRIAKAVLETISHSPNAVQRATLIQQAGDLLGLPPSALQDDLRYVLRRAQDARRGRGGEEEAGEGAAATHPAEEVALCEHVMHLTDSPKLVELIREYLPPRLLSDPACRRIVEAALEAAEKSRDVMEIIQGLDTSDRDSDRELIRLAAEVQMAPKKVKGKELSPTDAVQDIILRIWRQRLQDERASIEERMQSTTEGEQARRRQEITYALKGLRTWEQGAPLIEMELMD